MAKNVALRGETEPELKRHYSMKVLTQVGSIERIDWGWSSYEDRQRRGRHFHIFDGYIAVLALLQFSMVSFAAAFDPFNLNILGVSYALDVFFVLDIIATVVKSYTTDTRNVEMKQSNSKLDTYLKSYFILDVLGLLPTDMIILSCSTTLGVDSPKYQACIMPRLGWARVNRLISGYKIFRVRVAFFVSEALSLAATEFLFKMEAEVGSRFVAIRAVYYVVLSWVLLHVTACVWYVIPCSDYSHVMQNGVLNGYCHAPSWIFSGGSSDASTQFGVGYYQYNSASAVPKPNLNIYAGIFDHGEGSSDYRMSLSPPMDIVRLNATVGERYFYSLYWAITTMTSVGLGDVHAISVSEMIFAVVAQLTGMIMLFGIIQGSITSMLTNFDSILFQYKHRISAIMNYLRDQNQSTELVCHVLDFYNYLWKHSSGMSSAGLFDALPFALRSEIAMELCGSIIDRSPLFQDISASFLRMLSLKFKPMLALPEQVIMKKGELSDLMVYIQSGELEVLSDDENEVPVLLLRPGKLFGEINLITRMPRKYSVRAIAHCDLVVLRTEDLMDCLQSYPEIADELRQRAEERTGVVQQRVQEGLLAVDNQEAARIKKQQKDLSAKMEELQSETGVNLRPLMTALRIDRPQETLKVSDSMELFKIHDPMDERVLYHMGSTKQQFQSRFRQVRQALYNLSIDPDGLFYYFWERTLIFMVIVTFFLNTYVGFFQSYSKMLGIRDPNCPSKTASDSQLTQSFASNNLGGIIVIILAYVMDLFFIIDYCLRFVTQIKTANGKITDHRTMALTYLRSIGCYTDFLAVFPIEIFAAAMVGSAGIAGCTTMGIWDLLGYLKVNRALRVLTLPQFFDYLSTDLKNPITSVRILKFCLYIGMLTQVCAVALYLTACNAEGCIDSPVGIWTGNIPQPWVIPAVGELDPTGRNGTVGYRYTTSLYFAVTLMTTVGYGDIYPKNILEQVVVNIVMFVGVLTYGYCLAVLTATIANLDAPRVDFQTRLFGLINYMKYNKLTQAIQQRAIESVALLWTVSEGEEIPGIKSMTSDMPEHLMEDIQVDDLVHLIAGIPIFKNIEEHILKRLAPAVRRYMFPADEFIIQTGDLISELFVIRRGFCNMFHPDQSATVIALLHPGMYFGEIGFLFNRNEIISVKTITHCEVLTIPRAAFDKAAVHTEWLALQMGRISQERKYYDNLVHAAKNVKPNVRRRKEVSPTRMSEPEKRELRYKQDLNAVRVPAVKRFFYRALVSNTIPMDSRALKIWELVRLAACVLQFILAMIQVAFQFETWEFFSILYLLDVHAMMDIYVKFHIQYTNDANVVVTHPYMTARRYLNSNFWLDCFCVVPFEIFCLASVGAVFADGRSEILHWIMYISLNRLFHIHRIPLAFHYLESDIKVDTSRLLLAKYCTYFVLYITLVTCLPLIIECPPMTCAYSKDTCYFKFPNETETDLGIALDIDHLYPDVVGPYNPAGKLHWFDELFDRMVEPTTHSRVKRDNALSRVITVDYGSIDANGYVNLDTTKNCTWQSYLHMAPFINDTNHDPVDLIVTSLYWAVTTTTTTGFGDIYATNQTEQVLFLCIMISGTLFYGYILACISAAQANGDAPRARFFERLIAIQKYMKHEHLTKPLQKRVVRYYEYLWLRTQGTDSQGLIVGLPPSLTGELALQLYRKVIDQIPIFKTTPLGFKKMVAAIIKPLYIMEGEYVTRIGDIGADLFFLYRGSVEVQYRSGDFSPTVIRCGRLLGEVAFLTNQKTKTSFRARENTDLYYAPKAEFDLVLDHFPDVRDRLMEEARENMELEAEHLRLFEARPRRAGDKHSLSYQPLVRRPLTEILQKWYRYSFRSDDLFIRYFHKFTTTALRVVSVLLITYQAGFNNNAIVSPFYAFYVVNYLLEFVFIIDMVLTMRIGFLDEYGNEVLEPSRIRQRYFGSTSGFLVDVLSAIPYEIIALVATVPEGTDDLVIPNARVYYVQMWWAYLRLLRTPSRILRIRSFFADWLAELNIIVLSVRLTYSFTQLVLWMHAFSCLAYYIGDCTPSMYTCDPSTDWLQNTVLTANQTIRDGNHTYVEKYIISLYWITNMATSTGYGDLYAFSTFVRIYSMAVQLVGKCLFGFIIGDISSAMANAEISRQTFESTFQTMKKYLEDQQANSAIIARVQNYFNFLWTVSRGINDINSVLTDAPFCLRTEICFAVHNKDLRQLSLFRDSSDAFIRMLSAYLHQVQFVSGDYIIQQGDLVQEMYFLHRGEAVEVETGVEIGVIRHGSHINWQAGLIDWPASRTVRATDNCEVYILSRADLDVVVEKFHHEMELVCSATRTRLRDLLEEDHVELD